jgi:hypothetical protein
MIMGGFRPSGDFVAKTMEKVRSYEASRIGEREQSDTKFLPKPALYALSAAGVVLGMLNLVRTVWTLIAPTACL